MLTPCDPDSGMMDQLDKAAAAAETFHRANPDHLEMQDNLEMYRNMEGVKPGNFRDLEAVPHWEAYDEGTRLYQLEQFPQSIERLEAAVREYLGGLAECRAQCEGPYDFREYSYLEYQSHLYETISDHYVQVLSCNQDCVLELATKPGRASASPDFLPSHFKFLQYAYHKVANYDKALECSRTFLLFHPKDHSVLQNEAFYLSKLGADRAADIQPREEIKSYVKQSLLEKELLYYVMDTLGVPFNDPDAWTPPELIPQSIQKRLKAEKEEARKGMVERETAPNETRVESQGDMEILKASSPLFANLKVAIVSEQLNGSQRAVLDGVLSHEECAAIRRLANVAADSAKGYQGGPSADPSKDRIEGLTILRVLELAIDGVVDPDGARLYYEATVRTQTIVQNYFQLKAPPHVSFSHLLCRTAVTGHQENSGETSQALHAQNCLLDPEATACSKEPPAYAARDFSAFLYLNDEFEGGAFFFTNQDAETISAEIEPKCGRLVTFKSGAENPHGVQGVTGGQRCAVSLWFTLDRQHREKDRVRSETLMEQLFPPLPTSVGPVGSLPRHPSPPHPPHRGAPWYRVPGPRGRGQSTGNRRPRRGRGRGK
ncbi:prolyl 3-hydroxylase 1-like [Heptranchias perlo]|uniref:prolyl 3-hydroxylase 1-like n=1 Tax=Heptranchias perlo TaxID=212740 RepID=UPI00355A8186